MIRALYEDRKLDVHTCKMSMRFYRGLEMAITEVIELFSESRVILADGVFIGSYVFDRHRNGSLESRSF